MTDVVDRAKDSLITYDYAHAYGCDPGYPAPLIRALVAEVERVRSSAKTLGKIVDDTLTDVRKATGSDDLIGEDGDGDWMLVFERLAELRPARDAALAEVERLRAGGQS